MIFELDECSVGIKFLFLPYYSSGFTRGSFQCLLYLQSESISMRDKANIHKRMRVYHRYLGFFLAGIMAIYAISGVILIFRNTDFLKKSITEHKQLQAGMSERELAESIRIRNLRFEKSEGSIQYFKEGSYNSETGVTDYTLKKYPLPIEKLTHLHKATTKDPLFYLNIFFGVSLLFFVLSSFWMFLPKTNIFRKGLYFTLAGIVLTLLMLFW